MTVTGVAPFLVHMGGQWKNYSFIYFKMHGNMETKPGGEGKNNCVTLTSSPDPPEEQSIHIVCRYLLRGRNKVVLQFSCLGASLLEETVSSASKGMFGI